MELRTSFALGHVRRRPRLVALFDWLSVARQRRALAELDDHMLRDIGLTRREVARETDRPFWDVPPLWRR